MSVSQRKVALVNELYKEGIDEFAKLINSTECKSHTDEDIRIRRRDHISHFVLRSVVAFNVLKKRWFFKQETRLFKWRFSSLNNEGIKQFMRINDFNFTPVGLLSCICYIIYIYYFTNFLNSILFHFQISQNQKEEIGEYLQMSSSYVNNIDSTEFYKVPFSHVISLVKKRKVFVMYGEAFVPEGEIAFMFVPYFKRILISSFEVSICKVQK